MSGNGPGQSRFSFVIKLSIRHPRKKESKNEDVGLFRNRQSKGESDFVWAWVVHGLSQDNSSSKVRDRYVGGI